MITALTIGWLGLGMSLVIGTQFLDMPFTDILLCVLVSNLAALFSLLATLRLEKTFWFVKFGFNRTLKTWSFLTVLYFGIQLTFCPMLRDVQSCLYLIFPLILSTGFGMIAFGPIQDERVRRQQRKMQKDNNTPSLEVQSNLL